MLLVALASVRLALGESAGAAELFAQATGDSSSAPAWAWLGISGGGGGSAEAAAATAYTVAQGLAAAQQYLTAAPSPHVVGGESALAAAEAVREHWRTLQRPDDCEAARLLIVELGMRATVCR